MVLLLPALVLLPIKTNATETEAPSWDTDGDGVLEVLTVGNSFSNDLMMLSGYVAKSLEIDIYFGNLYVPGCTLEQHRANAEGDVGAYEYYTSKASGGYNSVEYHRISDAIKSRSWDYVSLQQGSGSSGLMETYNDDLDFMIDYVKGIMNDETNANSNPNFRLLWHMTWAYQQDSTHDAFAVYNSDQMTMYQQILNCVQEKIKTNDAFWRIIPSGTAIQNARTSLVGDNLTRDGQHMKKDTGRYTLSLMLLKTLGIDISNVGCVISGIDETFRRIAVESVNNAFENPFGVTRSVYSGERYAEGYIVLDPDLYPQAYWKSNGDVYNAPLTTASNSQYFFTTTRRLTREDLPVGSIIVVAEGWKYRPDGWVTDAKQSGSNRPRETQVPYVEVTEDWWGDFTLRAFNVSRTDGASLEWTTEEEMELALRILIPEKEHTYDGDCDAFCNGCYAERAASDHVYDGDDDSVCNGCGHIRVINLGSVVEGEHVYRDATVQFPEGEVTVKGTLSLTDCEIVGATEIVGAGASAITLNNTNFDGAVYATGEGEGVTKCKATLKVLGTSAVSTVGSRKDGATGFATAAEITLGDSVTVDNVLGAGASALSGDFDITLNITGGTFGTVNPTGIFLNGTTAMKGAVSNIVNNVSGGTFQKTFFGAADGPVSGSVTNNISGGVFNGGASGVPGFVGNGKGAVAGEVMNNVTGGTFTAFSGASSAFKNHGSFIGNYGTVGEKLTNKLYKAKGATLSIGNNFIGSTGHLTCPVIVDIKAEDPANGKISIGRALFAGGLIEAEESDDYGTIGYLDVSIEGAALAKVEGTKANITGDRRINVNGEGNRKGCGLYFSIANCTYSSYFVLDSSEKASVPGNCYISLINLKRVASNNTGLTLAKSVEGNLTVYIDGFNNEKMVGALSLISDGAVIGGNADLTLKNSTVTITAAGGVRLINGSVGSAEKPSEVKVCLEGNAFTMTSSGALLPACVMHTDDTIYGNLTVTYKGTHTVSAPNKASAAKLRGVGGTVTGNMTSIFDGAEFADVFDPIFTGVNVGGKLTNKVTGACSFEKGFYGVTGSYEGDIYNVFENATVTGAVYGVGDGFVGNVNNTVAGTCSFANGFYGTSGTVTGDVTNTVEENAKITNGTFYGSYMTVDGNVTNEVKAGADIQAFCGANTAQNKAYYVSGDVTNTLTNCKAVSVVGAGNGANSTAGGVRGTVKNELIGVTSGMICGNRGAAVGTASKAGKIENILTDCVTAAVWGSHNLVYGDVITVIHGGTYPVVIAQGTNGCTGLATLNLYDDGQTPLILTGGDEGIRSVAGYGSPPTSFGIKSVINIYGGTFLAGTYNSTKNEFFGQNPVISQDGAFVESTKHMVTFNLCGDVTLKERGALEIDQVLTDHAAITLDRGFVNGEAFLIVDDPALLSKIGLEYKEANGPGYYASSQEGNRTTFVGYVLADATQMSIRFDQTVSLNLLLPEKLVEAYGARYGSFGSVVFSVGEKETTVSQMGSPENGYYKFSVPLAHAGEFNKAVSALITFGESVTINKVGDEDLTLLNLAKAGVTAYGADPVIKELFQAVYNYAATATEAQVELYSLTVDPVETEPVLKKGDSQGFVAKSVRLLMGNSVGIRFVGAGDMTNVSVTLNGNAISPGLITKHEKNGEKCVDLFINANYLSDRLEIEVLDGTGTVLTFESSVLEFARAAAAVTDPDARTVAVATLAQAFKAYRDTLSA